MLSICSQRFFIASEHIAIDQHAVVFLELSDFLECALFKSRLAPIAEVLLSTIIVLDGLLPFLKGVLLDNHGG